MAVCLKLGENFSEYIYLEKLIGDLDFFFEVEISKRFFVLKVEKQNNGGSYSLVSIQAPITVINTLPIGISVSLLIKGDSLSVPLAL
jgi:hypothetical protein